MNEQIHFTHLHVHTEYSLLDGSSKIKELIGHTKAQGMDSIAITDHGVMYGVIDFYKTAQSEGIKPIIGCEVYVASRSRFNKDSRADDNYYHLILLAENNTGYHNLMKLVTKGFSEGYYYKPRVDYELLELYHEGLICLSACLGGEVANKLKRGLYDDAKEAAIRHRTIFGEDNYFLELQDHGYQEQKLVNQELFRMSKETGIPLVATNDSHYTFADDEKAHDVLLCIQTNKKFQDEDRMRYEGGQFYLKSPEEMAALFPYAREALENTYKIAQRCNVEIEFGVTKLPKYDLPSGYTTEGYLRELCEAGLHKKYDIVTKEVQDRLDYELDIISNMGYLDYFLVVWDFIKFAKDNDIIVGPGRGSGAGSIVAYSLDITGIDPLKYNLLFERFLNPERVSMPDLDIDFCYERRQEVIDYVIDKYGKERVVQIVTFGTMAARAAIRDVGRALDIPYSQVDRIAKLIPFELGITIEKALKMNPELRNLYEAEQEIKQLIDMSLRLEGLPRHTSMHAAGVLICQEPVDEYVPLSRSASDDAMTTQFTMNTLEELGLLKMDFLGLRTLTVIQNSVNLLKDRGIHIDIDKITYDDKKVFDLIGSGKTDGIFQVESTGMKSFMKELKPKNLEDIIAGISLYRPGPMDFIPKYLRWKHDQSLITYTCEALEPILSPTYGCIVYQEQVMQIVRDLAGYTLGRSDLVRRAMSKKKADVMARERKNFVYGNKEEGVAGCVANGISEEAANKIFDDMTDFAKYAFNKSHAAAYAVIAYQTAYLKCYYPVEFMAALLTSVIDHPGKVAEYILSCKQMKLQLLPPDINEGIKSFSVSEGRIRYGLSAIKNVGKAVIDSIVEERNTNGRFTDLDNFIERLSNKEVNKRTIESFIKAGALDSLGGTRKQFMQMYMQIVDRITQDKKRKIEGQMSLFDLVEEEDKQSYSTQLPDVGEFPKEVILTYEKEVVGFYLSGHPLEKYEQQWQKTVTATTLDFIIDEESNQTKVIDGEKATIGGIISDVTVKATKHNQMMAFITIEDLVGSVEVIIFSKLYGHNQHLLKEDEKVYVVGRVSVSEDQPAKLVCEKILPFANLSKKLYLQFSSLAQLQEMEHSLNNIIHKYYGEQDEVILYCRQERAMKNLGNEYRVTITNDLLNELNLFLGDKNVKVVDN